MERREFRRCRGAFVESVMEKSKDPLADKCHDDDESNDLVSRVEVLALYIISRLSYCPNERNLTLLYNVPI